MNGLPGSGKTTLAGQLAAHTGWPLFSKDELKLSRGLAGPEAMELAWSMAAAEPGPVIVESWWFRPRDLEFARAGLSVARATTVVELWCDVDPALARRRYAERRRSVVFADSERLATDYDDWAARAEPLAVGTVLRVDTSGPVDVVGLCERIESFR